MSDRLCLWLILFGTLLLMCACQNQNATEGSTVVLCWTINSTTFKPLTVTVERDGFIAVAGTMTGSC